ncbi:hypothetical protein [Lacticaseibacillus sp. GG6-2]
MQQIEMIGLYEFLNQYYGTAGRYSPREERLITSLFCRAKRALRSGQPFVKEKRDAEFTIHGNDELFLFSLHESRHRITVKYEPWVAPRRPLQGIRFENVDVFLNAYNSVILQKACTRLTKGGPLGYLLHEISECQLYRGNGFVLTMPAEDVRHHRHDARFYFSLEPIINGVAFQFVNVYV